MGPTRAETNRLIELFADKIWLAQHGAPLRAEQRAQDKFTKYHARMAAKYPDVDMESESFWRSIESVARSFNSGRPGPRPGKDY